MGYSLPNDYIKNPFPIKLPMPTPSAPIKKHPPQQIAAPAPQHPATSKPTNHLSALLIMALSLPLAQAVNAESPAPAQTQAAVDIQSIVATLIRPLKDGAIKDGQRLVLTETVTALSQGYAALNDQPQRDAALTALAQGDLAPAKAWFNQAARANGLNGLQHAQAFRNLGTLAFFDSPQAAMQAFNLAAQWKPDDNGFVNTQWPLFVDYLKQPEIMKAVASKVRALQGKPEQKAELAWALGDLGAIYHVLGKWPKAVAEYNKALALYKGLGDQAGMATQYDNIANTYAMREQHDKAIDFFQKSLAIYVRLGNNIGMASDYGNLGYHYEMLDNAPKAIENYQKAIAAHDSLGNKEAMAANATFLGKIYDENEQTDLAVACYQKALAVHESGNDKKALGLDYHNLFIAYAKSHDRAKEEESLHKALAVYEDLGDQEAIGNYTSFLGGLYEKNGELDKAVAYFERSWDVRSHLSDRGGMEGFDPSVLLSLARIYAQQNNGEKAEEYRQKALALEKRLDRKR
ncbi:hypothetical protein CEK71_21780 [Methylovulum psychrotolerans]|uniref:Uncharacterized protein n=2 Tax=Methylovulum psychrotolerans TaxID=1704499 RepID=A0A1Z4C4P5_9GAMM|nr:hypothetical protein CEK71_21780 [Methylovulum psychrotolerans]